MEKEIRNLIKLAELLVELNMRIELDERTLDQILDKIIARQQQLQEQHEEELIKRAKFNGNRI